MVHRGSGVCRACVTTAPVFVLTKTGGLEGALAEIVTSSSELETPSGLLGEQPDCNPEAKAEPALDLSLLAHFRTRLVHSFRGPVLPQLYGTMQQ